MISIPASSVADPNHLVHRVTLPSRCSEVFSWRLQRRVQVTRHAAQRMAVRGASDELLPTIIAAGSIRQRDPTHLWVWLDVECRADKLLRVVLVLEPAVVVKTVMHHWELLP